MVTSVVTRVFDDIEAMIWVKNAYTVSTVLLTLIA